MADLADTVGGILEMHYSIPLLGPIYSMRLAVTAFDPTPQGASNDYLYTGTGGFTPGESGLIATFAGIAACWAPYYGADWSLSLAGVLQNVDGTPTPLSVVPSAAPVSGSGASVAGLMRTKRSIWFYSQAGQRWRVWLRQLPAQAVALTLLTSTDSGGLDTRDRAWYSYLSGPMTAVVGRDGLRFQPGGKVRVWYDVAPAPYAVSG